MCFIKTGKKAEDNDLFKECIDLYIMNIFVLHADVIEFQKPSHCEGPEGSLQRPSAIPLKGSSHPPPAEYFQDSQVSAAWGWQFCS